MVKVTKEDVEAAKDELHSACVACADAKWRQKVAGDRLVAIETLYNTQDNAVDPNQGALDLETSEAVRAV